MTTEVAISYSVRNDREACASYVYLPRHPYSQAEHDGGVARTEDIGHGLALDYNASGVLIGIEYLWALPSSPTGNETG